MPPSQAGGDPTQQESGTTNQERPLLRNNRAASQKSLGSIDRAGASASGAASVSSKNSNSRVRMNFANSKPRDFAGSKYLSEMDDDLSIVASEDEDGSMAGSRVNGEERTKRNLPVDLVKKETMYVSYLRYLMLLLIMLMGILLSVGTFNWVEQAEIAKVDGNCPVQLPDGTTQAWTEELVDEFANGVEANWNQEVSQRLLSAYTFSVSVTSWGLELSSVQWPQVTVPNYSQRTQGLLASFEEANYAPFVSQGQRAAFETYAGGSITGVNSDDAASAPVFQFAPGSQSDQYLVNMFSDQVQGLALSLAQENAAAVWTDIQGGAGSTAPESYLIYPIVNNFNSISSSNPQEIVGCVSLKVPIVTLLEEVVPLWNDNSVDENSEDHSLSLYLTSNCGSGDSTTYRFSVLGTSVTYEELLPTLPTEVPEAAALVNLDLAYPYGEFETPLSDTTCSWQLYIVPTATIEGTTEAVSSSPKGTESPSNKHAVYTILVAFFFLGLLVTFLIYDWLVEKRQFKVIGIATKSTTIVDNLFPAQIRDRMWQDMQDRVANNKPPESGPNGASGGGMGAPGGPGGEPLNGGVGDAGATPIGGKHSERNGVNAEKSNGTSANNQVSVKQFLNHQGDATNDLSTQPIADLFSNTTVLFADIAGFTAWSSQREPPQVFTLLETLYRSFDVIAGKLKVFKVETIGDCYMAVTGLPNPDESHAVHMSRFAYQCLIGMKDLLLELEAVLGPGTTDLALRVGLHSGPVTAGVLRGEKSRFQLFGDTVNTASRMESTGIRGKIQVSQETGDLLMAAGKSHWLKPRDEKVVAKGKGELKTYWLDPTKKRKHAKPKDIRVTQEIQVNNQYGNGNDAPGSGDVPFDDKYARLIDWNVDVLLHHLARVISCRSRSPSRGSLVNHSSEVALLPAAINDVAEVVALPPFDADASKFRRARPDVSMLQQTRADLHEYVKRIAFMYRDVPFHNFEHASHVTLCANKLLNRLINSDEYPTEEALHNSTFGISSDPLTHFAIVFAALIHDVDHTGLPNAQLVKDHHDLADKFDSKSVAEQNSVHLGWEMLMDPRFERLRKCIYQTNVERKRFRQLVINSVLATDIADRNCNENRQVKWDRAFRSKSNEGASALQIQEDMNRKATAVIEHIIQVSDVAHTMQHWHIYRRWNERLFHEMHEAFQSGRVSVDPATNWYIGELGFFDYYLIPLAMKLKECGVFGASGYEYISYVLKNKKEWERKGRQVVQEMVLLYKDVEDDEQSGSSMDSDDYDSDDLEYDSPGDLSSDSEDSEDDSQSAESDIESLDNK